MTSAPAISMLEQVVEHKTVGCSRCTTRLTLLLSWHCYGPLGAMLCTEIWYEGYGCLLSKTTDRIHCLLNYYANPFWATMWIESPVGAKTRDGPKFCRIRNLGNKQIYPYTFNALYGSINATQ